MQPGMLTGSSEFERSDLVFDGRDLDVGAFKVCLVQSVADVGRLCEEEDLGLVFICSRTSSSLAYSCDHFARAHAHTPHFWHASGQLFSSRPISKSPNRGSAAWFVRDRGSGGRFTWGAYKLASSETGSVPDVGYYLIQYSMCCITDRPFSTVALVPGLFFQKSVGAPMIRTNTASRAILDLGSQSAQPKCSTIEGKVSKTENTGHRCSSRHVTPGLWIRALQMNRVVLKMLG